MVFAAASVLLGQLYHALVLKPKRIRSKLRRQGIKGPSPVFFYGNIPEMKSIHLQTRSMAATNSDELSHAWPAAVFPHLQQWRNEYGTSCKFLALFLLHLCSSCIKFSEKKSGLSIENIVYRFMFLPLLQKQNTTKFWVNLLLFYSFLLSCFVTCGHWTAKGNFLFNSCEDKHV